MERKREREIKPHRSCCKGVVFLYLCTLFLFLPVDVGATAFSWSFSGFGTLGLLRSDSDELGFYRERSQIAPVMDSWKASSDSRLGFQVDVELSDTMHSTVQWVPRDHAGEILEQNLDWAFIRWSPGNDVDIRIGRVGFDSFLLSDYRNVGYAYPWMRPPHEFYANVPVSHFDGIDIKRLWNLGDGYLSLKAYGGYSSLFEDYLTIELDGPLAGANLVYEVGNWKFKGGYTFIKLAKEQRFLKDDLLFLSIDSEYIPGLEQFESRMSVKGSRFHFMTLGAEYDDGTWLIQAEASYMNSEDIFHSDTASGYLSVGRRMGTVTLYSLFGISKTYDDKAVIPAISPDYKDDSYARETWEYWDSYLNLKNTDEKSVSIGLRWDFLPKFAFKAQWSHFWVVQGDTELLWGMMHYNNDRSETTVNVVSFGIDFVF